MQCLNCLHIERNGNVIRRYCRIKRQSLTMAYIKRKGRDIVNSKNYCYYAVRKEERCIIKSARNAEEF